MHSHYTQKVRYTNVLYTRNLRKEKQRRKTSPWHDGPEALDFQVTYNLLRYFNYILYHHSKFNEKKRIFITSIEFQLNIDDHLHTLRCNFSAIGWKFFTSNDVFRCLLCLMRSENKMFYRLHSVHIVVTIIQNRLTLILFKAKELEDSEIKSLLLISDLLAPSHKSLSMILLNRYFKI